jgi:hypothetical protein
MFNLMIKLLRLVIYHISADFAPNLMGSDQLLAYLTPHGGGLLHLSFGLFHQQESIRDITVDIFNELRAYPVRCPLFFHLPTPKINIPRRSVLHFYKPSTTSNVMRMCVKLTRERRGR